MRVRRSIALGAALSGLLPACDGCRKEPTRPLPIDAATQAPDVAAPDLSRDAGAPPQDARASDAEAALFVPEEDGGAACKRTWGPAEQPFHGPATLAIDGATLVVVANDSGRPRLHRLPTVATPAPVKPAAAPAMTWPPCEIAGGYAYCHGRGGSVTRARLDGSAGREIATAAGNARLAATVLGRDHTIVAYVQRHRTSEGQMLQAFVTLDEGETARLSDDGAGATSVRLVSLGGDRALAVYIDARTAMVPLHVRPVSVRDGKLALGEDTVVFVGGPPERGADFTVALAGERVIALLPNGKDATTFGMAAVALSEPPREDLPAVWSMYPNGLDPAPVAATTEHSASAYVARVRPAARAPTAPRVLELGRVDASGAFTSLGVVTTGTPITDVDVAVDKSGAIWVAYGDTKTTWLERRVCPK